MFAFKLVCGVVIFFTSLFSCLLPVRQRLDPRIIYVARHFGTGVIIATALVHLLEPASDALANEALSSTWTSFPWAYGFCLIGLFTVFAGDVWSQRRLVKLGIPHLHGPALTIESPKQNETDEEVYSSASFVSQMTGLAVLEVGIVLHSLFIGLSLAVADDSATALAIAIVLHQTFEGFGLGARLSSLHWPRQHRWVPGALSLLYAITTPLGLVIGIFISRSYDPESPTALIVTGISDALSAGVLLYTGLIELMADEVLNASDFATAPTADVMLACGSIIGGAFIMAILGLWV